MLNTILPEQTIPSSYYDCRYSVLREPLGFPRGAEILEDDNQAIHSYFAEGDKVLAVGRAHMISANSDGSAADHAGPDATKCPGFGPLSQQTGNRPAIQIRQMGTLLTERRKGLAALVLSDLEKNSKQHFGAKFGFLQAREYAIPFYQAQGWEIIDEPYSIEGIGPHRSMMKRL
jgi:predicted GNAT family N-acyltransferase